MGNDRCPWLAISGTIMEVKGETQRNVMQVKDGLVLKEHRGECL